MYNATKLTEKFKRKEMILGTFINMDSPFITETLGGCGFDFLWIDGEHAALDKMQIQNHLLACRACAVPGLVRVPWNDFVQIKAVLDMGADGIIVPMIRNLEEARAAIAATHYPPEGVRGMGVRRAVNWGHWDKNEYIATQDQKIWTILQIEHIDIVRHLDAIARLPGLTGFVVGPNDFAMSMTTKDGKACTGAEPEVQEQFDIIGEKLRKYNLPFGVGGAYSEKFVADWARRGANFMCLNTDFSYLVQGGKAVVANTQKTLQALRT
ncbi:putative 4-hydroxy-2-oxo-heptane-1,7-dioate aldolase [uncultured delta proteobacterium]|uniref:Putative 4-hydroxy-2-oxo-heptane-1,7-dioate aldolase n=1 Tax=uncultured delta proteobacterium TaxID=34034 RepID=A0A212KFD5_9DELT|nr:putative 4-hydroxy-2-oxo-heptane-1,7-dioate aldolase [uncultured delta proteobacterium]